MASAALFGASTPMAKVLVGDIPPVMLGGLLYLGSGLGLGLFRLVRDRGWRPSGLQPGEWPWLLGVVAVGGLLGPVALMVGLSQVAGATASLLLNLEAVLTALLAWVVFGESADRRIVLGMVAIVAGGVVLAVPDEAAATASWSGLLAIALACLCWAIDNNLTRRVSASDAVFIASVKGLVAGTVNVSIALWLGATMPGPSLLAAASLVGLLGYGVSLVLFVLALRGLGTARAGAYFATAPFVGAAVAIVFVGEPVTPGFWLAAAFMAWGVWLHVSETHAHAHTHEAMGHTHRHRHDLHHQHAHRPGVDVREPHTHWHEHEALTHKHPHYPDLHHRHRHRHRH
ncbi:MAG: EamA family transporter [Hydrogenophaga sp.]|nr:EamA family transporter [Hydrogenophaga sp.]